MTTRYAATTHADEAAYLVGIRRGRASRAKADADLAELVQLARAADVRVAGSTIAPLLRPDPAWFVGKGKVEEIARAADSVRAQVVIFDEPLSAAQVRNLEERFDRKVIDRGNVVLDIFAKRARTREAITQVELAQLEYLLPRLTGLWEHFSRQFGGIGTKGPGETQLETDRRQTRTRIATLKKILGKIEKSRDVQRARRKKNIQMCALVGYTNAGKSTLFNKLARAQVPAEDRMFTSLDAKSKRVFLQGDDGLENRQIVIVDTVGFVSKLPPQLVASFRSTLEELRYADLLLTVLDASHPALPSHIEAVMAVIEGLEALDIPRLWVINKADLVDDERVAEIGLRLRPDEYVSCSAANGAGIPSLLRTLCDRMSGQPAS
jgi:GTP-binding protein HflX